MFNPKRFELARKKRRLSKKELVSLTGLSIQTLSDWETGKTTPKYDNIKQLSETLGFSVEFLCANDIEQIPLEKINFRALTKMKASVRDAATATGELAIYLDNWIKEKFELPNFSIDVDLNDTPENIAKAVRMNWNIEDEYIENSIYLLEKQGIRVYSLAEESKDIDAFSVMHNNIPYIFLNTMKSAERSRFDAMHELAHIIMHSNITEKTRDLENEANRFASEMLMPENSVIKYKSINPALNNMIKLKSQWKVSLTALIVRFAKLGYITDWTYRVLMQDVNKRGYNIQEPNSIEKETSFILKKVINILKEDNISIRDIANDLYLSPTEINKLMFNMFSVISGSNIMNYDESKPKLKLL